jgi:hypothetical protein
MMSEAGNRQKARYRREMIGYTTATTIITNLCPRAGGWEARSGEVVVRTKWHMQRNVATPNSSSAAMHRESFNV